MGNSLTQRDFIERSRIAHGNKYDYSLVKTNRANTKVIIVCPEHGKFEQSASDHMLGRGCRLCGLDRQLKKRADNIEKSGKSFGTLCPDLLKEWGYEKNGVRHALLSVPSEG